MSNTPARVADMTPKQLQSSIQMGVMVGGIGALFFGGIVWGVIAAMLRAIH